MHRILQLLLTLCLISITGGLHAESIATGIVGVRMDGMKEMGRAGRRAGRMLGLVNGKLAFDAAELKATARMMTTQGQNIISWFPDTAQSRSGSETDAHASIWAQSDKFAQSAHEFAAAASDFRAAVEKATAEPDARPLAIAYRRVAKSCKVCHKAFRKSKR